MLVILVFALQPSKTRYIQRCDTCSQMSVLSDDTHEHIGREDERGERAGREGGWRRGREDKVEDEQEDEKIEELPC